MYAKKVLKHLCLQYNGEYVTDLNFFSNPDVYT